MEELLQVVHHHMAMQKLVLWDGAAAAGSSSHGHAQTSDPMHGGSALSGSSLVVNHIELIMIRYMRRSSTHVMPYKVYQEDLYSRMVELLGVHIACDKDSRDAMPTNTVLQVLRG